VDFQIKQKLKLLFQRISEIPWSKLFWMCVFSLAVVLLCFRVYLAFYNAGNVTIIRLIGILGLLYILFVLEGLIVSAIQIRRLDEDSLERYILSQYSESRKKMTAMVRIFRGSFPAFIVGRQLCLMIAVVSLAFTIDGLSVNEEAQLFKWMELQHPGSSGFMLAFLQYWGTTFLMSTLLPCWIGQLLPQFLAEERGVEFLKFPLARTLTAISLAISSIGAGAPSRAFFDFIRWATGRFTSEEKIGVGSAQVFEAQASYLGFVILERLIRLEAAGTGVTVTDRSKYEFVSGSISDFRHFLKVNMPIDDPTEMQAIDKFKSRFIFPHGVIGSETSVAAVKIVTAKVEAIEGPGRPQDLFQSIVLSINATSDLPLPRQGQRDYVSVETTYKLPELSSDRMNDFVFEIARPTREIHFEVSRTEDVFISPPKLDFILSDELPFRTGSRSLPELKYEQESMPAGLGWRLKARFPPPGSCALLHVRSFDRSAAPLAAIDP
jgi:hypothetical protein